MKKIFIFTLLFKFSLIFYAQSDTILWQKLYSDHLFSNRDMLKGGVLSPSNILYVTGSTEDNITNFDVTTLAINPDGSLKWKRTYTTKENDLSYDTPYKIVADSAGNIIIAGQHIINSLYENIFIIKYNETGDLILDTIFNKINQSSCIPVFKDLSVDRHGNIYLATQNCNDLILSKLDAQGKEIWHFVKSNANSVTNTENVFINPYTESLYFLNDSNEKLIISKIDASVGNWKN